VKKNLPNFLVKQLKNNQISIFLFHGVFKRNNFLIRNYTNKHIHENVFEKCIDNLKKNANPLSMHDVLQIYEKKEKIKGKNFVITFDDGFENNLSVAYPIMRDHKIPMMTYLTTKFIELNELSWIDKIEHAVELTKKKEIYLKNKIFKINTIENKINFLDHIRKEYKKNSKIDLYEFAKEILNKVEIENVTNLKNQLDLKINWSQVRKFNRDKYITFGGHGHTHKILSFLNTSDLQNEIKTCKKYLSSRGNFSTSHFSYPEGLKYCYSNKVIKMLKKFKFKCSPTAIHGSNDQKENLFNLKRITVA